MLIWPIQAYDTLDGGRGRQLREKVTPECTRTTSEEHGSTYAAAMSRNMLG